MASPPRKLTKKQMATAAELFATEEASRAKLKAVGISARQYPKLQKAAAEEMEAFREIQRQKLQDACDRLLDQVNATVGSASALQAATAYGIFFDKVVGSQSAASQSLHLHLGNIDRGQLMQAILGRNHERTERAAPKPKTPATCQTPLR